MGDIFGDIFGNIFGGGGGARAPRRGADIGYVMELSLEEAVGGVDKTIEIPLYYRKNVELANPALGNYAANGTLAGSTWNGEDWFRQQ